MAPKGIGAGTAAGATPTNTAAGAAGGDGTGPTAIQVLDELQTAVPDFNDCIRTIKSVATKKRLRDEAAAARAAQRAALQQEAREHKEDEEEEGKEATDRLQALAQQMGMRGALEEAAVKEQALWPLPPREAEPKLDLDPGYLQQLSAAAQELGLGLDVDAGLQQEAFCCALRSGFVQAALMQRGEAGRPLLSALFAAMTSSPDAETAGAAFVVLMALLGDGSVPSPGAGAGGWPPDVDRQLAGLTLDAHYGLPAALATGGAAAQARQTPCRLACVPTDAQLLQALQENGFHPGGPPAGPPAGGRAPRQQQQQQASGPAGGGQRQGQQEQEEPALVLRLQTVKLVLHSAAAVCRYCRRHPAAAAAALSRKGVSELLLAALQLELDPSANQLQEQLDAAVAELLDALDASDWQRKLPQLAERLADMGPSHTARLKLLRKLPTQRARGLALQQFGAALLLERLLPAGHKLAGKSAINRRDPAALNPAAVIAAQPWFNDPKALVAGAASGEAQAPRGGYSIETVGLILKACHLLMWPHMLSYAAGEPSCASESFQAAWHGFLLGIQKHIRSLQPEDQTVKTLASYLDLEYQAAAEGLAAHEERAAILE
ncbi:hypothetical protein ABPG77_002411 [Micractinium sp. CCAP 211/92]